MRAKETIAALVLSASGMWSSSAQAEQIDLCGRIFYASWEACWYFAAPLHGGSTNYYHLQDLGGHHDGDIVHIIGEVQSCLDPCTPCVVPSTMEACVSQDLGCGVVVQYDDCYYWQSDTYGNITPPPSGSQDGDVLHAWGILDGVFWDCGVPLCWWTVDACLLQARWETCAPPTADAPVSWGRLRTLYR